MKPGQLRTEPVRMLLENFKRRMMGNNVEKLVVVLLETQTQQSLVWD